MFPCCLSFWDSSSSLASTSMMYCTTSKSPSLSSGKPWKMPRKRRIGRGEDEQAVQTDGQHWHLLPALTTSTSSNFLYLFFLRLCRRITKKLKTKGKKEKKQAGLAGRAAAVPAPLPAQGTFQESLRKIGSPTRDGADWPSSSRPSRGEHHWHGEGLLGM